MTGRRRDLMFQVMSDQPAVGPYLHHLDQFYRCDDMLSWLVKSRLTGKEFLNWAKFHFGVSMLDMSRFILKKLEKKRGERPILWGRDVK